MCAGTDPHVLADRVHSDATSLQTPLGWIVISYSEFYTVPAFRPPAWEDAFQSGSIWGWRRGSPGMHDTLV